MWSMPSEPFASATVVVLRDGRSGPEVLLVRRHERSGDFAGASVFPGGLVEPNDSDPALGREFAAEEALAALAEPLAPETARALYVAACRELFEEAALLLARTPDGRPLERARIEAALADRLLLQAGELPFRTLLERERAVLALDCLRPFTRWITPEIAPRRWDARFFLAEAPPDQTAQCDGTETCEALWMRPRDALEAYSAGEHQLAPPTFRVLEELRPFATVADAFAAIRAAGPGEPILPVHLSGQPTVTMVYPGDRDYPTGNARGLNRIVLHEGRWRSERGDG
jgi:8-oxo-dGTP pyrophosphatase MutT (NUDIX family)